MFGYCIRGQTCLLNGLSERYATHLRLGSMGSHLVLVVPDARSGSWPAKYLGRVSGTLQPSQIERDSGGREKR